MRTFSLEASGLEGCRRIGRDIDDDVFASATAWGADVADEKMIQEISVLRQISLLGSVVARCHLDVTPLVQVGVALKDRKLNNDRVLLIKELRAKLSHFKQYGQIEVMAGDSYNLSLLNELFDIKTLGPALVAESDRVLDVFANMVSADMKAICEGIRSSAPAWESCRGSLTVNKDLQQQLIGNANYHTLGPLAKELRDQTSFSKAIASDGLGLFVHNGLLRSCQLDADFAVETVAFSFFFFEMGKIKDITNVVKGATEAKALRAQMKKTKVPLTDEMEALLASWEDGSALAAPAQAPPAPAGVPASAPVVPPASGAAPPPAAAGSPSVSLRDRLAKRQRTH